LFLIKKSRDAFICPKEKKDMKTKLLALLFTFMFAGTVISYAQNNNQTNGEGSLPNQQTSLSLENISRELAKISKTVADFNLRLKNFSETFSSNQGLRLTEKQQKLLAAFEYLNRAEQRLSVLQKLKFELAEKQSALRLQIAKIETDLKPDSIDRNVAVSGSTDAEEQRESRRRALSRQRAELLSLIHEMQNSIDAATDEIRQTDLFLKNIRLRIFPEIEKELLDL
jgi:predicted  nucleic acid-binding Zn-ribbon protein